MNLCRSNLSLLICFAGMLLVCSLPGCRLNPDVQGSGTSYLQGVWEEPENTISYRDTLMLLTRHSFTFTCDSFYATLQTSAKANYYQDSCFNDGRWTEYLKGTYTQSGDTIRLSGIFTRPDFKVKASGCYRNGPYQEMLLVKQQAKQTLVLQSNRQHAPVRLTLKKRTVCKPREL